MDVTEQDRKRRTVRMAVGLALAAVFVYAAYIGYFFVSAGAS
jgi:hypothetical protein